VSEAPRAAVVVVGSEILEDGRRDTNGPFIEEALAREGMRTVLRQVVGDDREAIAAAIRTAAWRAPIVIVSGGLGPTFDDLTREGAADALGLGLDRDPGIEAALRARLKRRGLLPPESIFRMADVLTGAEVMPNAVGSAPGLFLAGPPTLALLPGVPAEMESILDRELMPRLRAIHRAAPPERLILKIAGMYESQVEALLTPAMEGWKEIDRTILASPGDVTLILRAGEGKRRLLDGARVDVEAALGDAIYSDRDEGIESAIARMMLASSLTLATAESCTAGMLGGLITSVPGASAFYLGGAIAYADGIKRGWLDVPGDTLDRFGAVSGETAAAMARGVRARAGSDLALSITGIAGPGGGTPLKPVGRVHVALAAPWGEAARTLDLPGDRATIRIRSCRTALDLLRLGLLISVREGRR
jgi:nicotinamide-nucleotide amidase